MLTRRFNGRAFRKSSRSGAGNDCVYLPAALNAAADSKSGVVLAGDTAALLRWLRH